jgi:hypothetical protein
MAWTTPITWTAGTVVGAANLNEQLRDNFNYLLSRPRQAIKRTAGADYTTTSTSFVNIDATNLSINLTMSGSAVLVAFSGVLRQTESVFLDFSVDGTRHANTSNGIGVATLTSTANDQLAGYTILVTGLSVGSHTFNAMWRVASGTGVLRAINSPVFFSVIEVA